MKQRILKRPSALGLHPARPTLTGLATRLPPSLSPKANWKLLVLISSAISTLSACGALNTHYTPEPVPTPTQFNLASDVVTDGQDAPQHTPQPANSRPQSPVPSAQSDDADDTANDTLADNLPTNNPSEIEWWRHFKSAELNILVDRALANNPEIRIALAKIVQSKARFEQAAAGKLPTISAPMTLARQSALAYASLPSAGLRADWRLDIWGEQSALSDSAAFQLERTICEYDNVQRNMVAALLNAYIEYLSLNDRIRIARETERILQATMETMEKRFEVGEVTLPELEQQKAAIYAAHASIPILEQQRMETLHSIAAIVGSVPGDIKLSDQGIDSLSAPAIRPGIPSSLLLTRPDIRASEAQLKAANADINVARAKMLPPLDLYAERGYRGTSIDDLFAPKSLFLDLVARLTINIFDGGRRQNELEFTKAAQEEMVEGYARTVRQAIKDVESALNTIRMSNQRLTAQRNASEASRKAWEITTRLYGAGHSDYLTQLDTQRSFHRYLEDYQRSRMDLFKGHVALLQALGNAPNFKPSLSATDHTDETTQHFVASGITVLKDDAEIDHGTWQVELAGLYPKSAISSVWRDLKYRFPDLMENLIVRPRLQGQVVSGIESPKSWYRLYLAEFHDFQSANTLCQSLNTHQQRCKVVPTKPNGNVAHRGKPHDSEDDES